MKIIRQRNYSSVKIKQKEYNKILDKIKNNVSKKITKSIVNEINSIPDSLEILEKSNKIRLNKNKRSYLYKKAKENKARVSTINIGTPVTTTKETAQNILLDSDRFSNNPRKIRKYKRRALSKGIGKYQIVIPPKTSAEALSHEIGHVMNLESKNPVVRNIAKISSNPEVRRRHNSNYELIYNYGGPGNHGRHGIKNVLKDFIENKSILSDEKRASKRGIKILKKSGASKEEINKSKENMKAALDIYKHKGNVNWKTTLRNTIQSKNKRTSDIFYD